MNFPDLNHTTWEDLKSVSWRLSASWHLQGSANLGFCGAQNGMNDPHLHSAKALGKHLLAACSPELGDSNGPRFSPARVWRGGGDGAGGGGGDRGSFSGWGREACSRASTSATFDLWKGKMIFTLLSVHVQRRRSIFARFAMVCGQLIRWGRLSLSYKSNSW